MIISVRLEGGLGDVLLGNRFVVPLREKYPEANFRALLDTEGSSFQEAGLRSTYGHFYESITTIPRKKFNSCPIWSPQYGVEDYRGVLENVPDEFMTEMLRADKFYDLHVDLLNWLDYDVDFLRYHRFFPRPKFTDPFVGEIPKDFIVVNLVSESSMEHRLDPWYLKNLVNDLAKAFPVIAIATPKTTSFYQGSDCSIVTAPIGQALELISHAKVMLSVDSGLRYVAFGCDVPVITFSKHALAPHNVLASHKLRWLINPELCIPLNYYSEYVVGLTKRIADNKGCALIPSISDFDAYARRRNYELLPQPTL